MLLRYLTAVILSIGWTQPYLSFAQDYVDECPDLNGFYADAVQCDRYYECKNGEVNI
jgi:hypothetical protein